MRQFEFAYYRLNGDANISRCYRTLYTFLGNSTIHLIDCNAKLKGNLFKARNAHKILRYEKISDFFNSNQDAQIIIFERNGKLNFDEFSESHLLKQRIIIFIGEGNPLFPLSKYQDLLRIKITTNKDLLIIGSAITALISYKLNKWNK